MANVSFRFLVIIFLILPSISKAQISISDNIVESIVTVKNKKGLIKDSTIFMVVTDKSCAGCYVQLCNYLDSNYGNNYDVKLLILMKKDLFKMQTIATEYKKIAPCGKEVLFLFTDDSGTELQNMASQPSPQLIIKESDKLFYFSYPETISRLH